MNPHAESHRVNHPPAFRFGSSASHDNVQKVMTDAKVKVNGAHMNEESVATPPLGVLSRFKGTNKGFGWNTIFRPNSTASVVNLPTTPSKASDNLLLLNMTSEVLTFSQPLGEIPNRGLLKQPDISLNGVSYTQAIRDETFKAKPGHAQPSIHFETGLWMHVPSSSPTKPDPTGPSNNGEAIFRLGSIPHGTTINAQCFDKPKTLPGAPVIPKVSITPTLVNGGGQIVFDSQTLETSNTTRIPQDLTGFERKGLITAEMLANPNVVLTNANKGKDIIECTTFTVSAPPGPNQLGGGTANIAFLAGNDSGKSATQVLGQSGNANASSITATFWICKVRAKIMLRPGQKTASPVPLNERDAVPSFEVDFHVSEHREVTVQYDQIQYSQLVILEFAGLDWPHCSVATLAPTGQQLSSAIVRF